MLKLYALIAVSSSVAVGTGVPKTSKITLAPGDDAPAISISKWAKGTPVTQVGHGKVTLVEFGSSWCGPCRMALPHISQIAKDYAGKVAVLGVDTFEHMPTTETYNLRAQKFIDSMGDKMSFSVAIDDVNGTMSKSWMEAAGKNAIPCTFVVDGTGKIAYIGLPNADLDNVLKRVVDGTFNLQTEQVDEERDHAKDAQDSKAAIANGALVNGFLEMVSKHSPKAMATAVALGTGPFKEDMPGLNFLSYEIVMDGSTIQSPDYKAAVRFSEKASALSGGEPSINDILAMAYYRAGRFADATATESAAVQKAATTPGFDAGELAQMKKHLVRFRAKRK